MGKILLLNASPRAPRSNSRRYAALFADAAANTAYVELTAGNHAALREQMEHCTDVVLVFPLYADGIPVTLLHFLKSLEAHPLQNRPVISVLINCGFLEPEQNDVAVQMVALFCRQQGYPFGSVLKIGSGEAILDSPFRFLAARKIRRFAAAVVNRRNQTFKTAMPISKPFFVRAATRYWIKYGQKYGTTRAQMETMQIEGK